MVATCKYLVSYDFKKSFLFFFERIGKGNLELEVENGSIESVEEIGKLEEEIKGAYGFTDVVVSNVQRLK